MTLDIFLFSRFSHYSFRDEVHDFCIFFLMPLYSCNTLAFSSPNFKHRHWTIDWVCSLCQTLVRRDMFTMEAVSNLIIYKLIHLKEERLILYYTFHLPIMTYTCLIFYFPCSWWHIWAAWPSWSSTQSIWEAGAS